jgi:hypothetical protein
VQKKHLIVALVGVLMLAFAATAFATAQFKQKVAVKLTKSTAGASTGVNATLATSDPAAPNQKPKGARKITIKLPKGTKTDTKAVKQCNLNDEDVKAGKCPKSSLVGKGSALANAAPLIQPGDTAEDLKIYNKSKGLIFFLTDNAKDPKPGQTLVIKTTLRKNILTANVPALNVIGTKVVLTTLVAKIKSKSKGKGKHKRVLIKLPAKCPKSKKGFATTVTHKYDDGSTDKQTVYQKCKS